MDKSLRQSAVIALLVAGALFMEQLDGTVIATALPQMAQSFGVAAVDLNIGMSAYLLTVAVFIPASGWVTDRFGARTVFASAIVAFTVSSVLCAASGTLWQFTAARVLQGIGGAMMVPVGRLIVLRNTEKQHFVRIIAYLTWPALTAPVVGPPLGGFITTYSSWQWIFLLNVPLGVVGLGLALILIPNTRGEGRAGFDWSGFALTGLASFSLMYGLEAIGRNRIDWFITAPLLCAGLGAGIYAVRHARRAADPLLDLTLFKVPSFAVTVGGGVLFRTAISAVPFLLPLMFQLAFGLSPLDSGLLLLAVFAGNLGMKPATTTVLGRFGFRRTLIWNGVLAIATGLGLRPADRRHTDRRHRGGAVSERPVAVDAIHHHQCAELLRSRSHPHERRQHAVQHAPANGKRTGRRRRRHHAARRRADASGRPRGHHDRFPPRLLGHRPRRARGGVALPEVGAGRGHGAAGERVSRRFIPPRPIELGCCRIRHV